MIENILQTLNKDITNLTNELETLGQQYSVYSCPLSQFKSRGLNLAVGMDLKSNIHISEGYLDVLSDLMDFCRDKKSVSKTNLEDWCKEEFNLGDFETFGSRKAVLQRFNYL